MTESSREWELKAACRNEDPAVFFPSRTTRESTARAKRVCLSCPVREECLAAALVREHGLPQSRRDGIVAGLVGAERWQMSRDQEQERGAKEPAPVPSVRAAPARHEPAQCGTPSGYQRHRNRGETACRPCKDANNRAKQAYLRTGSTRSPA
ncbi:WhiB family transcriptional regulator [Streptomyces sp. NPDC006967]|uniref:WhiB family transcriptional regulator n=1 Tax=Streptomyces sp. NPDC006967 TaxID=3156906 RepID=UPI0033FFAB39